MKALLIRCMFFTLASVTAWAQRIETPSPDPNQIIHVKTAMNHLTVIELGQPVTAVAAGSPAFKIEWRENKVFVQPTEAKLATNLFIWTASGRMNYELEPAGSVEQMDFVIGQPGSGLLSAPGAPKSKIATTGKPQPVPVQTAALLGGKPVRMDSFKEPKNRVIVLLKDVFQQDKQLFIRYAIRNDSKETYEPGKPQVFTVDVPHAADLHHLANYQLTDKEARQLKDADQNPVEVLDMQLRSPHVVPGEETVGVVGMKLPVGVPVHGRVSGVPRITFEGYPELGSDTNNPQGGAVDTYEIADTMSHIHGKHSFAYGFDIRPIKRGNFTRDRTIRGEYDFSGVATGALGVWRTSANAAPSAVSAVSCPTRKGLPSRKLLVRQRSRGCPTGDSPRLDQRL